MANGKTADLTAVLTALDSISTKIIMRAAPVSFRVAQTTAELEAVYRLRYRVAIENAWAKPEDFPNGFERDNYDDRAIQITAWSSNVLVGTTRMILPELGQQLPTEDAFDLIVEPRGKVVDVGRTCRDPAFGDPRQRIFSGILCQTWLEMRARGFTITCGAFTSLVIRLYQRLGFKVIVLGKARFYWGEERHPILIQPEDSIILLQRRAERFK